MWLQKCELRLYASGWRGAGGALNEPKPPPPGAGAIRGRAPPWQVPPGGETRSPGGGHFTPPHPTAPPSPACPRGHCSLRSQTSPATAVPGDPDAPLQGPPSGVPGNSSAGCARVFGFPGRGWRSRGEGTPSLPALLQTPSERSRRHRGPREGPGPPAACSGWPGCPGTALRWGLPKAVRSLPPMASSYGGLSLI